MYSNNRYTGSSYRGSSGSSASSAALGLYGSSSRTSTLGSSSSNYGLSGSGSGSGSGSSSSSYLLSRSTSQGSYGTPLSSSRTYGDPLESRRISTDLSGSARYAADPLLESRSGSGSGSDGPKPRSKSVTLDTGNLSAIGDCIRNLIKIDTQWIESISRLDNTRQMIKDEFMKQKEFLENRLSDNTRQMIKDEFLIQKKFLDNRLSERKSKSDETADQISADLLQQKSRRPSRFLIRRGLAGTVIHEEEEATTGVGVPADPCPTEGGSDPDPPSALLRPIEQLEEQSDLQKSPSADQGFESGLDLSESDDQSMEMAALIERRVEKVENVDSSFEFAPLDGGLSRVESVEFGVAVVVKDEVTKDLVVEMVIDVVGDGSIGGKAPVESAPAAVDQPPEVPEVPAEAPSVPLPAPPAPDALQKAPPTVPKALQTPDKPLQRTAKPLHLKSPQQKPADTPHKPKLDPKLKHVQPAKQTAPQPKPDGTLKLKHVQQADAEMKAKAQIINAVQKSAVFKNVPKETRAHAAFVCADKHAVKRASAKLVVKAELEAKPKVQVTDSKAQKPKAMAHNTKLCKTAEAQMERKKSLTPAGIGEGGRRKSGTPVSAEGKGSGGAGPGKVPKPRLPMGRGAGSTTVSPGAVVKEPTSPKHSGKVGGSPGPTGKAPAPIGLQGKKASSKVTAQTGQKSQKPPSTAAALKTNHAEPQPEPQKPTEPKPEGMSTLDSDEKKPVQKPKPLEPQKTKATGPDAVNPKASGSPKRKSLELHKPKATNDDQKSKPPSTPNPKSEAPQKMKPKVVHEPKSKAPKPSVRHSTTPPQPRQPVFLKCRTPPRYSSISPQRPSSTDQQEHAPKATFVRRKSPVRLSSSPLPAEIQIQIPAVKLRPLERSSTGQQIKLSTKILKNTSPVVLKSIVGAQHPVQQRNVQRSFTVDVGTLMRDEGGSAAGGEANGKWKPHWRREEEGEEEEAEAEEAPSQSEAVEESAAEEPEPEAPKEEEKPKPKAPPPRQIDEGGSTKTEAELAMLAQKRKHEEEEEAKLAHYEEQRRIQREKEEEELRLLKEKQERRKREREEEDKLMAERKAAEEERRRVEDEERKAKAEADRQKKEADKLKRQQLMAGLQASGGPNFEITRKDKQAEKFDKFGNIVKAKSEMGMTKEQQDEQKRKFLTEKVKPLDAGGDVNALRSKIKELHARLTRLEGEKYDMEKRRDRQEYDLKELNERQRQISRNKALKKGLNPDEVTNSPHPPKVPVASKYDRQIDRRSYHDRFTLFENENAYPHFPNIPISDLMPSEIESGVTSTTPVVTIQTTDEDDEPIDEEDAPAKPKKGGMFHGSARPPSDWGRKENEELENLRKNMEPPKYQEAVKIEGARPPMEPVPVSMEADEDQGEDE